MAAYQMYRNTTLGDALQKTLDEQIADGSIPPALALRVMLTFDKCINKALNQRVKTKIHFKAERLKTYRFCDNVWTFVMEQVEFRDIDVGKMPRVKFVACDGKAGAKDAAAEVASAGGSTRP